MRSRTNLLQAGWGFSFFPEEKEANNAAYDDDSYKYREHNFKRVVSAGTKSANWPAPARRSGLFCERLPLFCAKPDLVSLRDAAWHKGRRFE